MLSGCVAFASAAVSVPLPVALAATMHGGTVSVYDLIELQISYTTILARYYHATAPRTLVDGARTGIAAQLVASGIRDWDLPLTPPRVDFDSGGDRIDTMVLSSIARYGSRVDGHRLVEAAVGGELAALRDPYSLLFYPTQFKKFDAYLGNATFGGIGAVLSFDATRTRAVVQTVLAGGPASRAGIVAGDAIAAVDGHDVSALGGQGVLAALRGKIGSPVTIDVVHAGGATQSYTLVRAAVRDPEVQTHLFGSVGYVRLARFGDKAGDEVDAALDDLQAHGARAFVLDLRANGGGYGDEATAVASAFIPNGIIYTMRERSGTTTVAHATGHVHARGPLAVLVDGDTASAAEIVAGALQDDGVAVLFGSRTFGKGVVQSIFPLPDGSAIKLTTASYATPKGRDLDGIGITPDVIVPEPAGTVEGDPRTDPPLAAALGGLAAKR